MDLEDQYPQHDRPFHQLGHFVCGAAIAQVHLNLLTGKVKVLKVVVAQDVGRAINPIGLEGQIEGAVVMEVGSAFNGRTYPRQNPGL